MKNLTLKIFTFLIATGLLLADPPLHVASFDLLPVVITATGR